MIAVDDDLWSAVGDPTRRRMLDLLLAQGDGTATSLSEHLPVTRQAIAKHLGVLDRAGLLAVVRRGRERWNHLDVLPTQAIHDRWISHFAGSAVGMLGALRDELEADVGR